MQIFCTGLLVFAALVECSRILNCFYNIVVLKVCLNFNVLESALELLPRDGHPLCEQTKITNNEQTSWIVLSNKEENSFL